MSYIPNTPDARRAMLSVLGMSDFSELYSTVPESVRLSRPLNLPAGLSEPEVTDELTSLAEKNVIYRSCFRGAGAYRHFIPAVVDALSQRNEFVTAYTPYQAEMSQGILQNIFEYQTMICSLTGMDVSNASVYDGASAAGEAAVMLRDRKRSRVLISGCLSPEVLATIKTYALPAGMEVSIIPEKDGKTDFSAFTSLMGADVCGAIIPQPGYFGLIEPLEGYAEALHSARAKLVCYINPIASALLKSPGECGADFAIGEGQPLGLPVAFGGPYLGFMAAKDADKRKLPGRIVGKTTDHDGTTGYCLTLQAREQHIRREKAQSNICSNEAWCALRASIYMAAMGAAGMKKTAAACYAHAHYLADELQKIGFKRSHTGEFFHEFVTELPLAYEELRRALDPLKILPGLPLKDGRMLWCATELNGKAQIDALINAIKGVK